MRLMSENPMVNLIGLVIIGLLLIVGFIYFVVNHDGQKKDFDYWAHKCSKDWYNGSQPCSDKEVYEYVKRLGWPNQIEE